MKKKVLTLVLSMAMVLSMGLTAYAATSPATDTKPGTTESGSTESGSTESGSTTGTKSPSEDNKPDSSTQGTTTDGTSGTTTSTGDGTTTVADIVATVAAADSSVKADKIYQPTDVKAESVTINGVAYTPVVSATFTEKGGAAVKTLTAKKDLGVSDVTTALKSAGFTATNVKYAGCFDVTLGTAIPAGGIDLKFGGFDSAKTYVLYHYDETKGAWEVITTSNNAGTLTAHFNSLSPIVVYEATVVKNDTSTVRSPKTGE